MQEPSKNYCKNCGSVITQDDTFCPVCGKKVKIQCPNCGNLMLEASFCPKCGEPLHDFTEDVCENFNTSAVELMKEKGYCRGKEDIYFGTYPQTEIFNQDIITCLEIMAGNKPTYAENHNWTPYGYFIDGEVRRYMWYIDKEYKGEMYRGVYFISYRPIWTNDISRATQSHQQENGYEIRKSYWFKYEPIKWRILEEDKGNVKLIADVILDSQQFDFVDGKYSCNYANSTLRAWLNDTFYNLAFNDIQKARIINTEVKNGSKYAFPDKDPLYMYNGVNENVCEDTLDNIFIPSEKEVTNPDYKFNKDPNGKDSMRQKAVTDYATCQGATKCGFGANKGFGTWWLRSPSAINKNRVLGVGVEGYSLENNYVLYTSIGIVPMVVIKL